MNRSGLQLGIASPIVAQMATRSGHWTETAGIQELAALARRADELGFSHLTCAEHVFMVDSEAGRRGSTYWDPLATFGYLSAVTTRIRFATLVLVLGYHHPLEIAKRYGTLDVVSNGRLILGLGVGTMKEEFDQLGVPFEDRGARADDALECLRSCLSVGRASYKGPYYEFHDVIIEPHAVQPRVPIWIGGRTPRSLRRAVEHGDGWSPFGLSLDQCRAMLDATEVPAGFDVVLGTEIALDPITRPEEAEAALATAAAAGATICTPAFVSNSLSHYLEQLEALAS
jgi:probable F420-dependent oxidoreductase